MNQAKDMQIVTLDNQIISVVNHGDSAAVRKAVLDEEGHIQELPAPKWKQFPWDDVRLFMHEYPVYVLPTTELLDVLEDLTADYRKVIEIGAGIGSIGRLLGIKMTDSYMQQDNKVAKMIYELTRQPVIKYPPDVIKADALTAYRRFKPDCILGCYVTHKYREDIGTGNMFGVDFERLLPLVKRLILVGNKFTHAAKPIMSCDHTEIDLKGGLITRSSERDLDRIFVWDNL